MTRIWHHLLRRGPCSTTLPSLYLTVRSIVSSKLFIGGLSYNTQEDTLRQAFSAHGDIQDVRVITDRETGRSRGFGFVTFGSEIDAEAALQGMDGKVLDGRAIRVDYASNSPSRTAGFGGGGGFEGNRGGFGSGSGFGGTSSSVGASSFGGGNGTLSAANLDNEDVGSDNEDFSKSKF